MTTMKNDNASGNGGNREKTRTASAKSPASRKKASAGRAKNPSGRARTGSSARRAKNAQDSASNAAPTAAGTTESVNESRSAADHERIATRAYYLWEESGRVPGREMDHWLEAERQVRGRRRKPS